MILAIDPGTTGALAVLRPDGSLHVAGDLPTRTYRLAKRTVTELDPVLLDDLLRAWPVGPVVLERMTAQGRNGSLSNYSLGHTYATITTVLALQGRTVHLALPTRWKKDMGVTADKKTTLALARERWGTESFPLEKHHNRAEAALLGLWHLTCSQPQEAAPCAP